MRSLIAALTCAALALLLSSPLQAEPLEESFDLRVPVAPTPRTVEGRGELVYELHLDNASRRALMPQRIEVLDAASARLLAVYEGAALAQRLDLSGLQWKADSYSAIPSGRRGVLFVELDLDDALPASLRHRVAYADERTGLRWVEGGGVAVRSEPARMLAAPLRGGPWVAVYDPRWERGHRRVAYALGGRLRTPGRYAVDWVKLDGAGLKSPPGSDEAARSFSHGQDVLAVGDGVIVQVNDQLPERSRLSERLRNPQGNALVLKLDSGEFAHYGHLRPGSATRAAGSRVKAGDKIAEVGFSGGASDPQLHFALTDGPEELASEGLPYVFAHYRGLGRYTDVAQMGAVPWTPAAPVRARQADMPAPLAVLDWDR